MTVSTVKSGKAKQAPYPQKVLIISDEHKGAKISNFSAYQASILTLMTQYDHVVQVGDNAELFYIRNEHAEDYARLLDTLAGKGTHHWKNEMNDSKNDPYHRVKRVIRGETLFLKEFLERFPHVSFHKVLGNHENVIKFRHALDDIQQHHPNFEWSPEAIRIGDGLFTHAHLQMSQQTDAQFPQSRLREAKDEHKWRDILYLFEQPGHSVVGWLRYPEKAARLMHDQLKLWDGTGELHYIENRHRKTFSMDWVKNVFFGHTHYKFDNLDKEGVLYHNPGAVIEMTSNKPEDLGILEAELHQDGTLRNVRPVRIFKDKHYHQSR